MKSGNKPVFIFIFVIFNFFLNVFIFFVVQIVNEASQTPDDGFSSTCVPFFGLVVEMEVIVSLAFDDLQAFFSAPSHLNDFSQLGEYFFMVIG